jgi:hypothetical protein
LEGSKDEDQGRNEEQRRMKYGCKGGEARKEGRKVSNMASEERRTRKAR